MGNLLCCLGGSCCSSAASNLSTKPISRALKLSNVTLTLNLSRLLYASYLFISFILAILLRNDVFGLWRLLSIRNSYQDSCSFIFNKLHSTCDGNYMVLRVSFVCFVFFAVHAIMASPLFFCASARLRLALQYNGCCFKLPVFIGMLIVSFFIPNEFFQAYGWFALCASAIFIALQMLLIIDWAFEWQESWLEKGKSDDELGYDSDDEDASCLSGMTIWMWLMVIFSMIFTAIGLSLFVTQLVLFGTADISCHLNRFFIVFTLILGIIMTLVSLFCGRGLLPASIVYCFATTTVLSALLSEPPNQCSRLAHANTDSFSNGQQWMQYLSTGFMICVAAFSLIRTAITTGLSARKLFQFSKPSTDEDEDEFDRDAYSEISDDSMAADIDEEDEEAIAMSKTQCSQMMWSHIVFSFASCFMAMVLTNWSVDSAEAFNEDREWGKSDVSWVAVGMKMTGAWGIFALFAWCCIAPRIFSRWRQWD